MKIGQVISENQPEEYKKIKRRKKRRRRRKKENLSFTDYESLMKHDSYCRHNGAIKQTKWGK